MSAPTAADRPEVPEAPPSGEPTEPTTVPIDDNSTPVDAVPALDDEVEGSDGDEPPGPREDTEEEILEPKVDPVERILSDDKGNSRDYLQRDFLYFQQVQMYALLGRATKIVLEGESGLGMDDLFNMLAPKQTLDSVLAHYGNVRGGDDAPDRAEDPENLEQAAKMLSAFARVISISPEMILEFQCIVLDIPKGHINWAKEQALPRIDREMGNDIMHTFIDQNWGVLEGFFTDELPRLAKRATAARKRHKSTGGQSKR